jgi:hypothetical protein
MTDSHANREPKKPYKAILGNEVMRPFLKFLMVLATVLLVVYLFVLIARPHLSKGTDPTRIPSYGEVVPVGFSAQQLPRVVDVRSAGPLLEPRLPLVKISNDIVETACPSRHQECIAKALYQWTKTSIEHQEVVLTRQHIVSPEETLLLREGDSTTMAILLAALLRGQGFQARIGHTAYSAFVQTTVMNNTIRLDPGCGGCVYGRVRYNGPETAITWVE